MATEGALYIITEKTLEKIEIQFVPPSLKRKRTGSISTVDIIGRNNPKYHYSGGETTMPLRLDFYAQEESKEDVIRKCLFLESLVANDGLESPPERVRLIFGKLFINDMWIIKSCESDFSNFDKPAGYLPKQAYVDLVLVKDTDSNEKRRDIRWK